MTSVQVNDAAESVSPEQVRVAGEFKHTRPLTSCYWEPQGRYVLFGAEDHLIHRLDCRQLAQGADAAVVPLAGHDSWVRSLGASPDGERLYSGGYDGRLILWPLAADSPQPLQVIQAHAGWVRALAVSPDGQSVATCGNDRLVKLWDADGKLIREFSGHQSHVYHVVFTHDGRTILSCDLKGTVYRWPCDGGAGSQLVRVEQLHGYDTTFRADIGGARDMTLSSDGRQLAIGGITNVSNAFAGVGEAAIALVDLADGKLLRLLQNKDKTKGTSWGAAHHRDGFWIGLSGGGGGGWLFFWKNDAAEEFHKLKLKSDGRGLSLAPDGTRLAVAHADQYLRIYSLLAT